jgi:hypothetical protein
VWHAQKVPLQVCPRQRGTIWSHLSSCLVRTGCGNAAFKIALICLQLASKQRQTTSFSPQSSQHIGIYALSSLDNCSPSAGTPEHHATIVHLSGFVLHLSIFQISMVFDEVLFYTIMTHYTGKHWSKHYDSPSRLCIALHTRPPHTGPNRRPPLPALEGRRPS